MTRAELLLWPAANNWGASRRTALEEHLALYLTLYPDERTCAIWASVVDRCRRAGRPIQTADAWIAAVARQWALSAGDHGFQRLRRDRRSGRCANSIRIIREGRARIRHY